MVLKVVSTVLPPSAGPDKGSSAAATPPGVMAAGKHQSSKSIFNPCLQHRFHFTPYPGDDLDSCPVEQFSGASGDAAANKKGYPAGGQSRDPCTKIAVREGVTSGRVNLIVFPGEQPDFTGILKECGEAVFVCGKGYEHGLSSGVRETV